MGEELGIKENREILILADEIIKNNSCKRAIYRIIQIIKDVNQELLHFGN